MCFSFLLIETQGMALGEINLPGSLAKFDFEGLHSLKLTASLPLKIGRAPKGNDRLPPFHFQG